MKNDTPSSRSSRISAGFQSILTLLLFAFILLAINYLGFKHFLHRDLTQSQIYTLSPKTAEVLKKLDAPLSIYIFLDEKNRGPGQDQIANLLKEYQRVGGKNVVVERIDAAYDFDRAAELQKRLHFNGENPHFVIFEYKDHNRFVKQEDMFDINPMTGQIGSFKGEQQLTGAIVALMEGKSSKVYFTEGHGEHSIQNTQSPTSYGLLEEGLKNENLEPANLNLASTGDVPADASAVVIAGPVISLSPIEAQALQKYVENNGKLMILLDPYVILGLDDLLKKYGLKYENDLVLYRAMSNTGSDVTIPLALIYQGGFSPHPITTKFAQANLQMQIMGARSVALLPGEKGPNPKVQFLLQTDPIAFGWVNKTTTTAETMTSYQNRTFDKATDIPGPLTIAAAYDGGMIVDPASKAEVPSTRIIVVGASRFLQKDTCDFLGANFFENCLDWLVKKDAILDISPKKPQEYGMSLSPMQMRTLFWCSMIFIPGAALIMGIFTWFSRRK